MNTLIRKSLGAAILISLGSYGILVVENPYVSAMLFTLGLLTICKLKLNLFTGKCGFILENHKWKDLFIILLCNLIGGYALGYVYGFMSEDAVGAALLKVQSWEISGGYFIRAMLCGVIMFIAVKLYNEGTSLGIFIGIPMFILCGFQHCIANVIYMGVAKTFHPALFIAIIGNLLGSLFMWYFIPQKES
ncbi:MAG: formate/nitrite transporter family protein [Lachnospiraceae bacterium]|nr:formate/nitrite transporter family protein [Lachnospiraceae bacterium]